MQTELKLLFYLKKTEVKQDGTCPLMGRITIGKAVAQFSAKLTVPLFLWDARAGRLSGKSQQAVEINQVLDRINVSIRSHYRQIVRLKGNVTAIEVKNAFQRIASTQETLVNYFARHNEEFGKRVGINRQASTAEQYNISLNHLIRFIEKKYKVSDIPFSKLDLSFIESFD
ncbi:Tyrosine recombinase XerC, partial [termite gut metagenome]